LAAAGLLLTALSAAAFGQPAETAPPPDLEQRLRSLLAARDLAGAVALLEPLQAAGQLRKPGRALLGTLYLELGRSADAHALLAPLAAEDEAPPDLLYQAGRAARAAGDPASAERFLERALERAPASPAARELGLLRGARGDAEAAYELLHPWAVAHPRDREARLAAAALALRLARAKEAEELLAGLPDDEPKVAILRAQMLVRQGRLEDALAVLEPLRRTAPPEMRSDVLFLSAETLITLGRAAEAIDLLRGAAGEARLAVLLASAYYQEGEIERALAVLEPLARDAAAAADVSVAELAFEYGRLLVEADRAAEAVPYLETATRLMPDNAGAWKSLGDALLKSGRRDEALAARRRFQEVATADNERSRRQRRAAMIEDPVARSILQAREALELGDGERALALLRREIAISPQDLRPRLEAARALVALDRRAEAEAELRRLLELAPAHVAAIKELAALLQARGERDEARQLWQRVLAIDPTDATARQQLDALRRADPD